MRNAVTLAVVAWFATSVPVAVLFGRLFRRGAAGLPPKRGADPAPPSPAARCSPVSLVRVRSPLELEALAPREVLCPVCSEWWQPEALLHHLACLHPSSPQGRRIRAWLEEGRR